MTKVKFVHTADLHLDTPFKGLSNWDNQLASKLKDATLKSFYNIIDLCIQEKVDFLIIAGDIFDSEIKSLAAHLAFYNALKKLSDNNIATYIVCGNHDPLSSLADFKELPDNVFLFNSSKAGKETFYKDGKALADIYGISFENKIVKKNLAKTFQLEDGHSPFSIAVMHGTIGNPGPHENYAPFTKDDVINKGFDYWALGHIHKKEIIRQSMPAIVYPGNPQGRDFGETGAKGCCLVEISDTKEPRIDFIPTQLLRFEEATINIEGVNTIELVYQKIESINDYINDYDEKTGYIIRLTLTGKTSLHTKLNKDEEIEELLEYLNQGLSLSGYTRIDTIKVKTQPDIDIEKLRKGTDFAAEVLKTFETYDNDKNKLEQLIEDTNNNMSDNYAKKEIGNLTDEEKKEIMNKARWKILNQLSITDNDY